MQDIATIVARPHGQLIRLETQRKRHLDEFFRLIREEPLPKDFCFRDENAPVQLPGDSFADNAGPGSGQ